MAKIFGIHVNNLENNIYIHFPNHFNTFIINKQGKKFYSVKLRKFFDKGEAVYYYHICFWIFSLWIKVNKKEN